MNDAEIRESFHRKKLRRHRESPDTLVVDELGLHHGASRADIAVVNGSLMGYEIKSDEDVLTRLPGQVRAYNAVFDRVSIITCARHLPGVRRLVPRWWGITTCSRGPKGAVRFTSKRASRPNPKVEPLSVARCSRFSRTMARREQG